MQHCRIFREGRGREQAAHGVKGRAYYPDDGRQDEQSHENEQRVDAEGGEYVPGTKLFAPCGQI